MIIVYRAANVADAHLIRQMLESEGIPAFIQGEYLQGGIGELPANTEILVHVGDENAAAARTIIDAWESAEPVEFDTDGLEAGGSAADDAERSIAGIPPAPIVPVRRGFSMLWIISALFFGVASGAAATLIILHAPQPPSEIDLDGDGRSDEFAYFFGKRLQRVEIDRNRDGKIDQILYYGGDTYISRGESDDDFDGTMEVRDRYRGGQISDTDIDSDGDGRSEYRVEYRFGLVFREEFTDADGILFKRVDYKDGWPQTAEVDSDGDGRLDTARRFDRNIEIVASEPLPVK